MKKGKQKKTPLSEKSVGEIAEAIERHFVKEAMKKFGVDKSLAELSIAKLHDDIVELAAVLKDDIGRVKK